MTMHLQIGRAALIAAVAVSACSTGEEAPKVPLGHPDVGAAGRSGAGAPLTIGPEAQAALDSGNRLYTAKAYAAALEQYRRAAALEPEEEAPLFGIHMVATATRDAALADSTSRVMRARRAAAGDSAGTGLLDVHKRVLPDAHPPIVPKDTNSRARGR